MKLMELATSATAVRSDLEDEGTNVGVGDQLDEGTLTGVGAHEDESAVSALLAELTKSGAGA